MTKLVLMRDSFEKVKEYYDQFDALGRLDSPAGIIEKSEMVHIVSTYVPRGAHMLDLGSGPGRYAIEFARKGYTLILADLSKSLIDMAKEQFGQEDLMTLLKLGVMPC